MSSGGMTIVILSDSFKYALAAHPAARARAKKQSAEGFVYLSPYQTVVRLTPNVMIQSVKSVSAVLTGDVTTCLSTG